MDYSQFIIPIIAYVLGSIPFGILISRKISGIDITQQGSGNIGAANVTRVLGLKYGVATLTLDSIKGFIPVYITLSLFPNNTALACFTGISALAGHMFSVFLQFRGGKGIATGLGVFLALSPLSALICMVLFIITILVWDFISLGSLVASLAMPVILYISNENPSLIKASIFMTLLICLKHRGNIQRLIKGKERKWRNRTD